MPNAKELAVRLLELLPSWPEGKLPSLRALALDHQASTKTVQAALDQLRIEGWIESRPRSGYWRKGQQPHRAPMERRALAYDLGVQLSREIKNGLHPWGVPLPTVKQLAMAWNCHVQTVTKALEFVVGEGLLQRKGRSYAPVRPHSKRSPSSPILACVGASTPEGAFRMDTDRESDFWRELGVQAAQVGLSLQRFPWSSGRMRLPTGTIGVVAATWHLHDPEELCQELVKLKIPVCLWAEDCSLLASGKRFPKLFLHDQGYGSIIGSQLARHLFDLGHRHLAYVSPWHASRWSQNRSTGLIQEASLHGGKVDVFHLDGESDWDRLGPAMADATLDREFPGKLLSKIVHGSSAGLRRLAIHQLGWNRIQSDLEPLWIHALESRATAWVLANDAIGCLAMDWLQARGVAVPAKISIAGFDDTVDALRHDLTSYRFSTSSMAREMIQQILSGEATRKVSCHSGLVVSRGSTRRV